MRHIIPFLTSLILITTPAVAKKISGQIVFADRTVNVTFNIPFKGLQSEPNFERIQYKVKYFGADGKVIKLKPHEAKEIRFSVNGVRYRMISCVNTIGGSLFSTSNNIFLELVSEGPVNVYNYYYTQRSGGMYGAGGAMMSPSVSYTVERYVLQKGSGPLLRPGGLSFKKELATFFADCPQLVAKIESKEFRRSDLLAMVKFYNNQCQH